jgi:hypothetical protein
MMSHRYRVPPRPVGSAALTPAKAAVYAQALQELIDNADRLRFMLEDFQRHIERDSLKAIEMKMSRSTGFPSK